MWQATRVDDGGAVDLSSSMSKDASALPAPRRPLRTTVQLPLRVPASTKALAERDAGRYGMPVSAYVGALITGTDPNVKRKPAAEAGHVTLMGDAVMRALRALAGRIGGGEGCEALRQDLMRLDADIAATLSDCLDAYENRVSEQRRNDDWSGE